MDKRRLLWILLVVFVLIFSFRIYSKITSVNKLKTTKIIPVKVMTPRIGEIQDNLILTGDIKGEKEVVVRPKLAGRVAEIYVKEGDVVRSQEPEAVSTVFRF